jgi:hypothetical protein
MINPWDVESAGFVIPEGLRFDNRAVVPDVRDVAKRVG